METIKQIKVPVIGGFETHTEIISDEYHGKKLGTDITPNMEIFNESVDHIEADRGDVLVFAQGSLKKSKIASLVWHEKFGARTVRSVNYAL